MRILILCNDFPPLNSIGARRPFSWFKYFKKHGIDLTVITKDWQSQSASLSEVINQYSYQYTIEENFPEGTIFRVPNKTTLPEKILISYGRNFLPAIRRALSFVYRVLSFNFPFFDKHYFIYRHAKQFLAHQKVDLILATGEPFILFKYAYLLHRRFHVPWVADFRDGWKLNYVREAHRSLPSTFLKWWEFRFEKKYLAHCSFITSVDPLLAEKLRQLHKKKAFVIYNGFEKVYTASNSNHTDHRLVINHSGTIYQGHQVEVLLTAVKELHDEKRITPDDLLIRFLGLEFYAEQKERIAAFSANVNKYLVTTFRLPFDEVTRLNAEADFLITFTEKEYPVIPAKTFEYIAVRVPVLVILDDHSILSQLITDLHAGYILNSVQQLKKFLVQKIQLKKENKLVCKAEPIPEKIFFYSRENQAAIFADILKRKFSE